MIDLVNNQFLGIDQRKAILERALYSQPFQHLLQFDFTPENFKRSEYGDKAEVNKDFYLTELRANFGEVFTLNSTLFNISLWSGIEDKSLWRFQQSFLLPTGQVTQEARYNTVFPNQLFDDRQYEYFPRFIRRGDRIQAQVTNLSEKREAAIGYCSLVGYYLKPTNYLSPDSQRGVNESLAKNIRYDTFRFSVDTVQDKTYTLNNDRTARLVLGFGIIDKDSAKQDLASGKVQVRDSARSIQWHSEPVPIEFLAPRLTALRDIHMYYLPMEYLFEPNASLLFEMSDLVIPGVRGFDVVMLTRTV